MSTTNIYTALLDVQATVGSLKKDEKNPFFKSNYVTLNAVREAVLPALTKNRLVLLQPTVVVEGKQYVRTTIVHADSKEVISSDTEVITKNATDAQQVGSGISYARRYGLMSILALAAEDDDGNTASGKASNSSTAASSTSAATSQAKTEASPAQASSGAKPSFKKPSFIKKSTAPVASTVEQEDEL